MSNRDRLYISKKSRTFIDELDNLSYDPIGIKEISRLDLFKIAVALGLNAPKEFDSAKDGLFNLRDIKTTKEKTLFNVILLGIAKNDDEIDDYSELEKNYTESEKCALTGFEILREKIFCTTDEELLKKQMFMELDILYQKNVKLG